MRLNACLVVCLLARTAAGGSSGLGLGAAHSCAVREGDGSLTCVGSNTSNKLGTRCGAMLSLMPQAKMFHCVAVHAFHTHSTANAAASPADYTVDLGDGRTAVQVAAGDQHTCCLLDNRAVKCWGSNAYGQLGSPLDTDLIVTVDIGMGRTAKAISAGHRHTCVILDNDSLKCFGEGRYGALGYGGLSNIGDNETPGELPSLEFGARRTVQSVACGGAFTCVILDN
eukprot:20481-Heterococcus_DN1.PRE.1